MLFKGKLHRGIKKEDIIIKFQTQSNDRVFDFASTVNTYLTYLLGESVMDLCKCYPICIFKSI